MRRTLVAALVSCAGEETKLRLLRFLAGLSADELQFLAGFQGARILEGCKASPAAPLPDYETAAKGPHAADLDHKILVLREYLARCHRGSYFDRASSRDGRSAAGFA